MKTELLKKIKKREKSFQRENDTDHCIQPDDFNTVETLGISDCGICCNELSEYLVPSICWISVYCCSLHALGKLANGNKIMYRTYNPPLSEHPQGTSKVPLNGNWQLSIHKFVGSLAKTSNNNIMWWEQHYCYTIYPGLYFSSSYSWNKAKPMARSFFNGGGWGRGEGGSCSIW